MHAVDVIATYRTAHPAARLFVFVGALARLTLWCARRGPRIVHVHTTVRGSLYRKSVCVAVARALRRPVVVHIHSGPGDVARFAQRLGPTRRAFFRRALSGADRRIAVSRATADAFGRWLAVHDVEVLPTPPPPAPSPASAFPRNHLEVLYLGGFSNPVKGGAVMADALPRLLSRNPRVRVTLAGPGAPPAGLRGLLADEPRLSWAGWLDAPATAAARARCGIFVLPSSSEGLPVAVLEAMAAGQAIVSTPVGGIPDVLTHDVDAVLVAPGDPVALADAVLALAADRGRQQALGNAARARAARLRNEQSGRLDALYRELCSA